MSETRYDAAVIGGGPAGSTAGAYLAMAGKRVLILEKEMFPRFHIGESLLPYNQALFEELGVARQLESAGFPVKAGAQFHIGNRSKSRRIYFRHGRFNRFHQIYQVERSVFDEILLRNAAAKGAEVLEGWKVRQVDNSQTGVRIQAGDDRKNVRSIEAGYLVDASGRANLTGQRDGLRRGYPSLKKLSMFSHYTGARHDEKETAGDIVIVREQSNWFWMIPLPQGKTSVGCVMDASDYARMQMCPGEAMRHMIDACEEMRFRMKDAQTLRPVQCTGDFSYYNRSLKGPRLLRAGDAAGFIDPVFSSGVYLAMTSGKRAARTLEAIMAGRASESRAFAKYEKRTFAAMEFFRRMVEGFYTHAFMEVLMEPRDFLSLPDAVNCALSGGMADRWAIRWRLWLFFWLVKRQARKPALPRISFS